MLESKISKTIATSGIITGSLLINKFYKIANKEESTRTKRSFNQKQQESIFDQTEFDSNQLSKILDFEKIDGRIKKVIAEEKLKEVINKFIRQEIEKKFIKRGWNPKELEGRVYYEIKESSVEVYVEWKNSIYEENFNFFDRFEICF